ncbi:MAG: bifunctional DNA-formamidopyrimidine glycosylase/DNA-(apurinic or apyrimidinic site) lyase [Candidatus Caenarcaniphilales bacterium]|nr:bifunctional DNA-formamidopyrimidine glycosylase/DNA-(apurinic or apyrimidinic site) lyase [Candidatus Caenarcaniphilales bacterium]
MPELPEVETVRKGLEKKVIGKKILKVKVNRSKTLENISPENFQKKLSGQRFKSIRRKAKYLFLEMENGLVLIVHLKMSGTFLVQEITSPEPVHTHIIFMLDNEKILRFKDLRAFGRISLYNSFKEAQKIGSIPFLAPEPIEDSFTLSHFQESLKKYKSPIKTLLLDQTKAVSGMGNIYADEALFLAGIRPTRKANSLKKNEVQELYASIKRVITDSIKIGGTSIRDYVQTDGSLGNYALNLFVYGKKKSEECLVCKTPIEYIRLGQRGTHFCPRCQK